LIHYEIPTFSIKRLKTNPTPGCCGISEQYLKCGALLVALAARKCFEDVP